MGSLISLDIFWLLRKVGHPNDNDSHLTTEHALTHSKTHTEGYVSKSINTTVHRTVSEVFQVPQLRHDRAVHHPNGKPNSSHWNDQVVRFSCKWNLETFNYNLLKVIFNFCTMIQESAKTIISTFFMISPSSAPPPSLTQGGCEVITITAKWSESGK